MTNSLLLIDFVNEISKPQGKFPEVCYDYLCQNNILDKANAALDLARSLDWKILWVPLGFSKDYSDLPSDSKIFRDVPLRSALQRGTWGTQIAQPLVPLPNEPVFEKQTISPFYNQNMVRYINENAISTLYLVGATTDMAILSTCRDAHDLGLSAVILEDACAAKDKNTHLNAIKCAKVTAEISSTSEALK